jgi:hypothetical protein
VILRVALAFDELKMQGLTDQQAIAQLQANQKCDVSRIVQTLQTLPPIASAIETRMIEVSCLEPGMVLNEELRSNAGLLLADTGQEVTYPLVVRLKNFHRRRAIKDKVAVLVAKNSVSRNRLQPGVN